MTVPPGPPVLSAPFPGAEPALDHGGGAVQDTRGLVDCEPHSCGRRLDATLLGGIGIRFEATDLGESQGEEAGARHVGPASCAVAPPNQRAQATAGARRTLRLPSQRRGDLADFVVSVAVMGGFDEGSFRCSHGSGFGRSKSSSHACPTAPAHVKREPGAEALPIRFPNHPCKARRGVQRVRRRRLGPEPPLSEFDAGGTDATVLEMRSRSLRIWQLRMIPRRSASATALDATSRIHVRNSV
jgi:hypothetical protein